MPARSYKTRLKISKAMKGTSNFAGQEHSLKSKTKIATGRGSRDPIGTKKWFVHSDSGVTNRKTQNPGGLYQKGRVVKEFIDWLNESGHITTNKAKLAKGDEYGDSSDEFGTKYKGLTNQGRHLSTDPDKVQHKFAKRYAGGSKALRRAIRNNPGVPFRQDHLKTEAATLTPKDKKDNEKAFMLKMIARKREREAEADREVTTQVADKIRPQQAARKAAGKKLINPKTGAEVGVQQKNIGPTPIPKGITVTKVPARKLPKRRKILQAGDQMLNFNEFLLEDEKSFHYNLGKKKALSGAARGETSDNYGPYASHYNKGYDDHKGKKDPNTKVIGTDSYGRTITTQPA